MILPLALVVLSAALFSLYLLRHALRLDPINLAILCYFLTLHIRWTDGRSGTEPFGLVQVFKLLVWAMPLLLLLVPTVRGRLIALVPRGASGAFTLFLVLAALTGLLNGPIALNLIAVIWLAAGFTAARFVVFRDGIGGLTVLISAAILLLTAINATFEIGIDVIGLDAPPQLRSPLGVRRLIGYGVHANLVGRNAAVLFLIAAFSPAFRRWPWSTRAPILCTAALALLWSGSRSSLIALVGTLLIVAVLRNATSRGLALVSAGSVLLVAFASNVTISGLQSSYGRNGRADELTTLTGRTDVWAIAWRESLTRPISGHGFAGSIDGLRTLVEAETELFWATHAHNWFLQTFYATGLLGAGLMLMAALGVAYQVTKPGNVAAMIGSIGVFTLIVGLTESPLGLLQTFLPAILWLGCVTAMSEQAPRRPEALPAAAPIMALRPTGSSGV